MADQLIRDYEDEDYAVEGLTHDGTVAGPGDLDALGTLQSWESTAAEHGETLTRDDLYALIQQLARRAAGHGS
jgi:hypothetical protein